jgi:NAD(P)H-quinone oxidoreductase subunit 4
VGVTTTDICQLNSITVTVFLASIWCYFAPIYLLSMLRQVFYNPGAMAE